MAATDALPVIQATLAPAFLMTGGGIFLNFVQARLFRVNDHLRRLLSGEAPASESSRRVVDIAFRRGRILRNALAFGVLALGFVVLTMLALLAAVFVEGLPRAAVVGPFAAGLASFAVALALGLQDTYLSFASLHAEFDTPRARAPGGR